MPESVLLYRTSDPPKVQAMHRSGAMDLHLPHAFRGMSLGGHQERSSSDGPSSHPSMETHLHTAFPLNRILREDNKHTRKRRAFSIHKIAERHPKGIDITSLVGPRVHTQAERLLSSLCSPVDEVHRNIECILDIALKSKISVKNEGQIATSIWIGVHPDLTPQAQDPVKTCTGGVYSTQDCLVDIPIRFPFFKGRVCKQCCGDGLQGQSRSEFLNHVGFALKIQVDLRIVIGTW